MIIKKLPRLCFWAALSMMSLNGAAASIDAVAARAVASDFVKMHSASGQSKFSAAAVNNIRLVHAEPSAAVSGANDYYAFNVGGGGFVIVAGEDRAARVLGYSDQGSLDFENLPYNLKGLLDSYKAEIEFLQAYQGDDLVAVAPAAATFKKAIGVEPLIDTNWGQEMPYYLQCPVYNGEYCVVGCVATAMAQVMKFWEYPLSCNSVPSYYCYDISQTLQALPATTFDYSLMLPSYCHWDYDAGELVQDDYTDEQAQAVAKLSRYCGQAVEMGYSPDGSGAYTSDQLAAMKWFGYKSSAQYVTKGSYWGWGSDNYTTSEWEGMMKAELNAGRPILYAANDPTAGGHAFVCDGYNDEGKFHFNFGWYGTCDGWYVSTALNMTHRDGEELKFNSGHEMLTGVTPPDYCELNVQGLNASSRLLVLGNNIEPQAQGVNLRTSYQNIKLVFALTDDQGSIVAQSTAVNMSRVRFVQGSDINGTLVLPADLQRGTYNLSLYYYVNTPTRLVPVETVAAGQLVVVGNVAKFNAPFAVSDVTALITAILDDTYPNLSVTDVTSLIDYILNNN